MAAVSAVFVWLIISDDRETDPIIAADPITWDDVYAVLDDDVTEDYLALLKQRAPETGRRLEDTLLTAARSNEDVELLRQIVLMATLSVFRDQGVRLRQAPVQSYDKLVAHFGVGVEQMSNAGSEWCSGKRVETFLRLHQDALIPRLVDEVAASKDAYVWSLEWAHLFLDALEEARFFPARHGTRTGRDKAVLQEAGLSLGPERWALALQIAAFSQAEGQDYETMRGAIEGVDVCEMGLALSDLSTRIPDAPRGRIWAQLLPEIFVGNAPFVVYVVNDYFFLD